MISNNYLGSEAYLCSICYEPISNPICPVCLTTQLDAWLTLYPNYHQLKKILIPKIRKFIRNHISETSICIKCHKNQASICPYCFTEFILDTLREINVSREMLKEFLVFFNFDLEYKGYYKESKENNII